MCVDAVADVNDIVGDVHIEAVATVDDVVGDVYDEAESDVYDEAEGDVDMFFELLPLGFRDFIVATSLRILDI